MAQATTGAPAATEPELIAVGTPVEVRSRFVGSWSRGFEVADHRKRALPDQTSLRRQHPPRRIRSAGDPRRTAQARFLVVLTRPEGPTRPGQLSSSMNSSIGIADRVRVFKVPLAPSATATRATDLSSGASSTVAKS